MSRFHRLLLPFQKFPVLIPGLISLLLFIYKFPYLEYGAYWDECWVYFPAVKTMAASGPTLLPNSLTPELYSGHPLLLLFLASSWITIFGDSNFAIHLFALLISIGFLFAIFYCTKKMLGLTVAGITTLFFSLQTIFIVQSSFLLLEVLVALLIFLAYYFFLEKKYVWFVLFCTLSLWTKESAYVSIPALILGSFIELLFFHKDIRTFFKQIGYVVAAFCLGFSFFIIQKMIVGWMFLPAHIGYIDLSAWMLNFKWTVVRDILFFEQGRKYLTFTGIAAILLTLIFKFKEIPKQDLVKFIYFSIFIFGFILFAIINFLSNRYLIAALPFVFILFIYFISNLFSNPHFNTFVLLCLTCLLAVSTIRNKNTPPHDTEFAYADVVKCNMDMVDFLESSNIPKDAQISTHFLMSYILGNPYSGYVTKPYSNVNTDFTQPSQYYVISCIEDPSQYESYKQSKPLKLVKRISQKNAWCELYSK